MATGFPGFTMVQTEPLLFNLLVDDWKNLASFFVTPAIGLSVAYLLGADLLKVPFVATDVPYKIPGQILAVLATTLCFIAAFTISCWLMLRTYPGPKPDVEQFTQTFLRPLNEKEKLWLKKISVEPVVDAYLILDTFDVKTDLRIFVNNSRVFGSYRDCVWKFECKLADESAAQKELISHIPSRHVDDNLYPSDKLNKLPLAIPLLSKLRTGPNYIDVFSNNSGLVGCHVRARFIFRLLSGKEEMLDFEITDGVSTPNPFRTISQSGSYRTCDQFRLPVSITLRSSP